MEKPKRVGDTYWILYGSTMILFSLLGGLYTRCEENVPTSGAVLYVANHSSYIDPCALGDASPRRVVFMGKAELFKIKLLKFLFDGVDCFPVKRGEPDRASLKNSLSILVEGRVLCLFPEGKRNTDGNLGKAEPGAVFIAERSGAAIVPVYISGADKMLDTKGKFHRAKVIVAFGEPFVIEKGMDREAGAELIMQKIKETRDKTEGKPLKRIFGPLRKPLEGSRCIR
jgi:1-acyl-sn-glycerol-3-phosphate acyltransferase